MDVWNASWNSNKAGSRRAQLICGGWPTLGAAYTPRRPLSIARNEQQYLFNPLNNPAARGRAAP